MSEIALQPPIAKARPRFSVLGVALMAFWVLAGAGLVYFLAGSISEARIERYGPRFLSGIWTTLVIVVTSVAIGAVLSLPVAAGRMSRNPIARTVAFAYSYFFRGTPLLAQTYLFYFGSGQFMDTWEALGIRWLFMDPLYAVILTFSLNTAAYQAEILAGSIRNVHRGQWEAARALGIRDRVTLAKVIVPQALITALRPYGNEIILMVKGSAIASVVSVLDLMGQTDYINSRTYDVSIYLWAAVVYLVIVEVLRRLWDVFERRLTRHLVRSR
jgi:polar amino acid transport system permease protein